MCFSDGPCFVSEVAGPSSSLSRLENGQARIQPPSQCVSRFLVGRCLVAIGSACEIAAGLIAVPFVPWSGHFVLCCRVVVVAVVH